MKFGNKHVMVVPDYGSWYAVVGLPLTLIPGVYVVTIESESSQIIARSFQVSPKQYRVERVGNHSGQATAWTEDEHQQILANMDELKTAVAVWQDSNDVDTDFQVPAPGPITKSFGVRTVTDDATTDRHLGVDISTKSGSVLVAPAAGVINKVQDNLDEGLTLLMSHGQGLFSVLSHLDHVDVQLNQSVAKGTVVGKARDQALDNSHIYWSVILNEAEVNPVLFLSN